jgi:hypothetical protein
MTIVSNIPPLTSAVIAGGFKHYQGLIPLNNGSGDPNHATYRYLHVPSSEANDIYRGDVVVQLGTGAGDMPTLDRMPPGLSNAAIAMDVGLMAVGSTTTVIAGVVIGFGLTPSAVKNGYQYRPASTDAWVLVDTDPDVVMAATLTTALAAADIGRGLDFAARNATFTSTRFGQSGTALDGTSINTTATLPFRLDRALEGLGNVIGTANSVQLPIAVVRFNKTRHLYGTGAFVT